MWTVAGMITSGLLGALLSFAIFADAYENQTNKCAKQHNVYRCEMIAVPVKSEDPR